jgi:hypothetical protein
MTEGAQQAGSENTAIREFQVSFPEAELTELRRRINATRWPERETVTDNSQGVRLATMQELARYWGTDHDWRKCEAKLNALPNFVTEIDGLDLDDSGDGRGSLLIVLCRFSAVVSGSLVPGGWRRCPMCSGRTPAPTAPGRAPFRS